MQFEILCLVVVILFICWLPPSVPIIITSHLSITEHSVSKPAREVLTELNNNDGGFECALLDEKNRNKYKM